MKIIIIQTQTHLFLHYISEKKEIIMSITFYVSVQEYLEIRHLKTV